MRAGIGCQDFKVVAGERHPKNIAGGQREAACMAVEVELDAADTVVTPIDDFRAHEAVGGTEVKIEIVRLPFMH